MRQPVLCAALVAATVVVASFVAVAAEPPPRAGPTTAPAAAVRPAPTTAPAAPPTSRPTTAPAAAGATGRPAAPAPDRPLTPDELHALFDAGKYADCIKQINRALALKGRAADPYDRYDLWTLRGECHLQLRVLQAAQQAFAQAATETKDPHDAAVARATVVLLKRARNFAYAPGPGLKKGDRPTPIDVVDAVSRRKALAALLADETAVVSPKIEAALDGRSLAPIATALGSLKGLDDLEGAAGAGDDSAQRVRDLRQRGYALMAKAVQKMGKRVDDVAKAADELVEFHVRVPVATGGSYDEVRTRRRGLDQQDKQDLKDIIDTCQQIGPNAYGLAKATGGKERDAEDLVDAADALAKRADRVLRTEYGY